MEFSKIIQVICDMNVSLKNYVDYFTPNLDTKPNSFSIFLEVIELILEKENEDLYSIGVVLALSNAIIGSLCAILTSKVSNVFHCLSYVNFK